MRYITSMRESPKAALLRVFGAVGVALGLLLGVAPSASAQSPAPASCATHAEFAKGLDSRYAEAPIGMGLASNGGVIELFSTGDRSTWTLVMTMPNGTSCALAAGQAWENIMPTIALGPQA